MLDVLCFLAMWHIYKFNSVDMAGYFQCGWFMFGVISQTVVIHTIRTPKIPFIQDRASAQLMLSTALVVIATLLIGFTVVATWFDLPVMVPSFGWCLVILMVVYMVLAQILKTIYIKINKEWV